MEKELVKTSGSIKELADAISAASATLLSTMTHKKIFVSAGSVRICEPAQIIREISSSDELRLGAYVRIIGPIKGAVMIMFPAKYALTFADIISNRKSGTTKVFDEAGISAINETCNILAGAYLTVLGKKCDALLFHSTPRFTSNSTIAATQNLTSGLEPDMKTIVIDAMFNADGDEINGSFTLFCEKKVVESITGE